MEALMDRIWELSPGELDEVFEEVLNRKRTLYPDEEILYMTLPKNNPEERNRMIECIIGFLEKEQGDVRRRNNLIILPKKPLQY